MGLSHTLVRRAFCTINEDSAYLPLIEEADLLARAAGDRIILAWVALERGFQAQYETKDYDRARTHFENSLALFTEARFPAGQNAVLNSLGAMEQELGNTTRAQTLYDQVLLSFRDTPSCAEQLPFVLEQMACVALLNGEFERATRLLGAASKGDANDILEHDASDKDIAADLCRRLGKAAFSQAWEAGSSLTLEGSIAFALERATPAAASSSMQRALPPLPLSNPLTQRELDILCLIAEGHSNGEIAAHFVLATTTVKWYVSQILSKLDVTNRTQAGRRARELGLVP
jgi:DNA-binding CsgD family transcriptional regulator